MGTGDVFTLDAYNRVAKRLVLCGCDESSVLISQFFQHLFRNGLVRLVPTNKVSKKFGIYIMEAPYRFSRVILTLDQSLADIQPVIIVEGSVDKC